MFKNFEIDEFVIEHSWKEEKDKDEVRKIINRLIEFENVPAYTSDTSLFAFCFKGHLNAVGNLYMVDYGYALDAKSIEKYVIDKYGDNDPNEYLLCASSMSMNYEKYYKNGTFINLDGKNTHKDFYKLKDYNELKKKAQYPNRWISFIVYDINRDARGNLRPEKDYPEDWLNKSEQNNN